MILHKAKQEAFEQYEALRSPVLFFIIVTPLQAYA